MKLALVIPALNEEQAIASTLRRALAARQKVVEQTDVTEMVIVFVNDGSTDRTQQIVDQPEFDEVVNPGLSFRLYPDRVIGIDLNRNISP